MHQVLDRPPQVVTPERIEPATGRCVRPINVTKGLLLLRVVVGLLVIGYGCGTLVEPARRLRVQPLPTLAKPA
jgi:hypothetical protein